MTCQKLLKMFYIVMPCFIGHAYIGHFKKLLQLN
nr:MAG TPA: chitin-binding domain protein [Caudoviricetes sp.]